MKVYVAGPMRGYPRLNFDAFDAARDRLRAAGHTPYSPADIDRAMGGNPDLPEEFVDADFVRRAMSLDITIIYSCDAIALLPGWERSSGATVELALALYLGLKLLDAVTLAPIYPALRPWANGETFRPQT